MDGLHINTIRVVQRFIKEDHSRHPVLVEHQYLKMASELAEAREVMWQIMRCRNLLDANLMAQTFLEVHPE